MELPPISLPGAIGIASLLLLVGHWLPLARVPYLENIGVVRRLANYVIGVTAVGIPLTWYWSTNPWHPRDYWLTYALSGLAVGLAYGLDWIDSRVRAGREAQTTLDATVNAHARRNRTT